MKTISGKTLAAFAALFVVSAGIMAQAPETEEMSWQKETVVTIEIDGQVSELSRSTQSFVWKLNASREDNPAQSGATFYNFRNRKAVLVNFESDHFAVMTFDELRQTNMQQINGIRESLPQRKQMLPTLRGQQREMMAAQIEAQEAQINAWARKYALEPTDETATIEGRVCMKYRGLAGENPFQEVWMAKNMPLSQSFKRYFAMGMAQVSQNEYNYFRYAQHFPIKIVNHYGPVTVTETVTNINPGVAPAEAFILPDNLKQSPNVLR